LGNSKKIAIGTCRQGRLFLRLLQQPAKELNSMIARPSMLSIAGLAIAAWLGGGITAASAQAIYADPVYADSVYADPYVGYDESPVVVAPGGAYIAPGSAYIARPPVVASAPIVRQRTVVVRRPFYGPAPAPVFGAPVRPYGYSADSGYVTADW
jgi:hypothetical protein